MLALDFVYLFQLEFNSFYIKLKVGDFGLASLKKTMYNSSFFAPEVLSRKCYSYKSDVWSIGCIMYTLLIGKPFDNTKKMFAKRSIPNTISHVAQNIIMRTLHSDPRLRPTMGQILQDEFFISDFKTAQVQKNSFFRFNTK